MKIKECIDRVDAVKPNQYSEEEKVRWLSALDSNIYADVILTHEYNAGEEEIAFAPYTINDMQKSLIAPFPYDELYVSYLKMKIDEENGETTRYNNSAILYNSHYDNYAKWYQKYHRPINKNKFRLWR